MHATSLSKIRALTLISLTLSMDSWEQIKFPSEDITAIQIKGNRGKLLIYNIYNDGKSNKTIRSLITRHRNTVSMLENSGTSKPHIIWLGDFNRHHPYWDDPNDERLFTNEAIEDTEILIEAVADASLELVLLSGTPTHIHNVTKKWMRLDQVFLSDHSLDLLIACDTNPDYRGIKTDHLPILTKLSLSVSKTKTIPFCNFQEVEWDKFKESLGKHMRNLDSSAHILNQQQLDRHCKELTLAIQHTITNTVPKAEICNKLKRWWTKELSQMCKHANKLGRTSYNLKADTTHAIHSEHKKAVKLYERTLATTKKQHWHDWLERADDPDIWTVHRLISAPNTDRGKSHIPALKYKTRDEDRIALSNEEKSTALAKNFFSEKPMQEPRQDEFKYP